MKRNQMMDIGPDWWASPPGLKERDDSWPVGMELEMPREKERVQVKTDLTLSLYVGGPLSCHLSLLSTV